MCDVFLFCFIERGHQKGVLIVIQINIFPMSDKNLQPIRQIPALLQEGLPEAGQKPWQQKFTYFMMVAAVLGQTFLGLQVYKTYTSKNVDGLSIYSYIALYVGYVMWMFYGAFVVEKRDYPLIISSALGIAMTMSLIIAIVLYGDKDIWQF
jgi:uncharacterized protein with PQ loop repeat